MRAIDADEMILDLEEKQKTLSGIPDHETDRAYIMIEALKLWVRSRKTIDVTEGYEFGIADEDAQNMELSERESILDYAYERYRSGAWTDDVIDRLFDDQWITGSMYRIITGRIPDLIGKY